MFNKTINHSGHIACIVDERNMNMEQLENKNDSVRGNRTTQREACPRATLYTTNSTQKWLGNLENIRNSDSGSNSWMEIVSHEATVLASVKIENVCSQFSNFPDVFIKYCLLNHFLQ